MSVFTPRRMLNMREMPVVMRFWARAAANLRQCQRQDMNYERLPAICSPISSGADGSTAHTPACSGRGHIGCRDGTHQQFKPGNMLHVFTVDGERLTLVGKLASDIYTEDETIHSTLSGPESGDCGEWQGTWASD